MSGRRFGKCQECGRTYSGVIGADGPWRGVYAGGQLAGLICPDCQRATDNTLEGK